jgi:hypothetical protein
MTAVTVPVARAAAATAETLAPSRTSTVIAFTRCPSSVRLRTAVSSRTSELSASSRRQGENDVAVVEQRMRGRTHDGTSFHNSYVWVYEFHGDLIHRMTEHTDTLLAHHAFHGVHPGQ